MAYLEISGKVMGTRWDGKIVIVKETYTAKFKGEETQRNRIWTCWFDSTPQVAEGAIVSVGGDLDTRIGDWTKKDQAGTEVTKQIVEHHLNNATLRVKSFDDEITF